MHATFAHFAVLRIFSFVHEFRFFTRFLFDSSRFIYDDIATASFHAADLQRMTHVRTCALCARAVRIELRGRNSSYSVMTTFRPSTAAGSHRDEPLTHR